MKILDIPQSGRKGLDVSMNGRYGQVRRVLVIPADPRTASQMTDRANLSVVAKRWRTLTENQWQAWNTTGSAYSSTARLGQSGPLTGLYGYRTCPGQVQGATRPHRAKRGRGVEFGWLMVDAEHPTSNFEQPGEATQSHIKATPKPVDSQGIATPKLP